MVKVPILNSMFRPSNYSLFPCTYDKYVFARNELMPGRARTFPTTEPNPSMTHLANVWLSMCSFPCIHCKHPRSYSRRGNRPFRSRLALRLSMFCIFSTYLSYTAVTLQLHRSYTSVTTASILFYIDRASLPLSPLFLSRFPSLLPFPDLTKKLISPLSNCALAPTVW